MSSSIKQLSLMLANHVWASEADLIPRGYEAALIALKSTQCKWPIGHPDAPDFHFCTADRVNKTLPYCAAHTWDAALKKRGRRPVVVSFGGTAMRSARDRIGKSKSVTAAGGDGDVSPVGAGVQ